MNIQLGKDAIFGLLQGCTMDELQHFTSEAKRYYTAACNAGPLNDTEKELSRTAPIHAVDAIRRRTGCGLWDAKVAVQCYCNEKGFKGFVR